MCHTESRVRRERLRTAKVLILNFPKNFSLYRIVQSFRVAKNGSSLVHCDATTQQIDDRVWLRFAPDSSLSLVYLCLISVQMKIKTAIYFYYWGGLLRGSLERERFMRPFKREWVKIWKQRPTTTTVRQLKSLRTIFICKFDIILGDIGFEFAIHRCLLLFFIHNRQKHFYNNI